MVRDPPKVRDPLEAYLDEASALSGEPMEERLTGVRAQLLAATVAWAPGLWLPSALLLAAGLGAAVATLAVGHRIEPSLVLLGLPVAVGIVAWTLALAACAVANLLEVRLGGNSIGMGRSLRMILEHGGGAIGSATRFTLLGVIASSGLGLVALTGSFPGLAGPRGLAVTGLLMALQVLAIVAAMGILATTGVALLLHPGIAAARARSQAMAFRLVWQLLRWETPGTVRRAAIPWGATALLLWIGYSIFRLSVDLVVALDARIIGPRFADLIAASPLRVIFGAPELLDPGAALGLGGILAAAGMVLTLSLVLGYVASFIGTSGYLLGKGLGLAQRIQDMDSGA